MMSSKNSARPRIAELASIITNSVAKLEQILPDQNAPWPSFEENAPAELPKEAAQAQAAILGEL